VRESKTGITVEQIKGELLYGKLTHARGETAPYPDSAIMEALYAAEDAYEAYLGTRFGATRVFSAPELRRDVIDPEIRVDDFDPAVDVAIAAFDYTPTMMGDGQWMMSTMPITPIQEVTKVFFWQPGLGAPTTFKIPPNWLRIQRESGRIESLPTTGPQALATQYLGVRMLNVFAGGIRVPQAIFVDYVAGLTPTQLEYSQRHLLRGIRLATLLNLAGVLSSNLSGGVQSGSLSLDGLSRSRSFGGKFGAYSAEIELAAKQERKIRTTWKQTNRGVTVEFA